MASYLIKLNKKTAFLLVTAVFLLFLDRYFKFLTLAGLKVSIIDNWFEYSFVPNYGIAFSLPIGGLFINLLVTLIIGVLLSWSVRLYKQGRQGLLIAVFWVILGAASNLADRLIYGYVVDYLDLRYFTIFNLADVMICLGVGYLSYVNLKKKKTGL